MRLLIAGGGIGGLTAALCAHKFGIETAVIEQAEALTEIGAGVQLSPNAMRVLYALGLGEALMEVAFQPQAAEIRDGASGAIKASIALMEMAERRWAAPYFNVHRADLIRVLRNALHKRAPDAVHLGARVIHYSASAHHVDVFAEDGRHWRGDALVGADGLHSIIARQAFGIAAPRDTQQIAWRAIVPAATVPAHIRPPPSACVWTGSGRHAVTYYVRSGALINFVGVVERASDAPEAWDAEGRKEEAARDFAGFHDTVQAIIAAAPQLHHWRLYDRDPLQRWGEANVTLLGDACHPMLPFMAQGAAMAIEDGFALARSLSQTTEAAAALRHYETLRQSRTARMQAASRANQARYHLHDTLQARAETAALKLARAVAPGAPAMAMDWIYGFDVTA